MVLLYIFAVICLFNCIYFFLFATFSSTKQTPLQTNLEVMETFQQQDERIKIVDVVPNEAFWASKKYALTLGIKKAKFKKMVFTDADCVPASKKWLTQIAGQLNETKELILGYSPYLKEKGFLNKLIRFETFMTAVQYFSYAKAGLAYMGVGRNLAYTSSLYYSVNGFMSHIKVASGDDDLFVNEAATKQNTGICISPEAFTYSTPKKTWKQWLLQKRRHITTASYYKGIHKFLLGTYFITNLAFWLLLIGCFIFSSWKITTTIVAIRFLIQGITLGNAAIKLQEKDLLYFYPIYDLFLVSTQIVIFISNSIAKPDRWK